MSKERKMLYSDSDIPQYGMRSNRLDSVGDYITSRRGSLSDLVFSSQNKLSRDSVFLSNKKTRTVSMATISRHLSLEQPSLTGIARETRSKTLVPEKRPLMKTKSSRELVSFASTPNAAKRNSKELVKTPLLLKRKRSMRKIQSMKAFDSLLCSRRKLHRFKVNNTYCKFRNFREGFYFRETSHMRSFVKIGPSRNGEITMSFTDVGKSCPSREFYNVINMSFGAFRENKILAKFFEFTVFYF